VPAKAFQIAGLKGSLFIQARIMALNILNPAIGKTWKRKLKKDRNFARADILLAML
jgi:hypothetical protein